MVAILVRKNMTGPPLSLHPTPAATKGLGVTMQPVLHYYFHAP
jgi:hypothetical protein